MCRVKLWPVTCWDPPIGWLVYIAYVHGIKGGGKADWESGYSRTICLLTQFKKQKTKNIINKVKQKQNTFMRGLTRQRK